MSHLDYTDVQTISLRSLQELDADLQEHRSDKELEREAHKFASVIVDVFNSSDRQ